MSNRAVMITGASGNLGRAVAAAFAADGRRLILVGSRRSGLESAFPAAPADWRLVDVDLTDDAASRARLGEAIDAAGGVDTLCAVAGGFHMGDKVHETSRATLDAMLDLNLRTLMNAASAVLPGMIAQGSGKIVTVGALSALKGAADMGAYGVAKSAVLRLTEAMAAENGRHGINVNAVLPSIIDTPENRAAMPKADPGKWVSPQALAEVIRFLASDAASAIQGALIPVTGRT
jgi:NAD(P)-dependent dehydrogenase (short-subunit alcohol dehydrogenase family)